MGGMKVAEGEEEFERPETESRPETGSPSTASDAKFRRFAIAAALFAALGVAGSIYFLGTTPVPGVKLPVNVWMGVAAAVFAGLSWFVLVKLSPRLGYTKPGQGRWARLTAYVGFGVLALFAAVALHKSPGIGNKWFGDILEGLWTTRLFGADLTLRPVFFPSAALFLTLMVSFHLYINRPNVGEFLIETQGEMKRVSWPTTREWIGSTIVVLVLVAVLSGFLYVADHFLSQLMQALKIGF